MPNYTLKYRSRTREISALKRLTKRDLAEQYLKFACETGPQPRETLVRHAEKYNDISKSMLEKAADGLIYSAITGIGPTRKSYWNTEIVEDWGNWRPKGRFKGRTKKARIKEILKMRKPTRQSDLLGRVK